MFAQDASPIYTPGIATCSFLEAAYTAFARGLQVRYPLLPLSLPSLPLVYSLKGCYVSESNPPSKLSGKRTNPFRLRILSSSPGGLLCRLTVVRRGSPRKEDGLSALDFICEVPNLINYPLQVSDTKKAEGCLMIRKFLLIAYQLGFS